MRASVLLGGAVALLAAGPVLAQSDADIGKLDEIIEAHTRPADLGEAQAQNQPDAVPVTQASFATAAATKNGVPNPNPYPSTYKPYPSTPTAIVGATVLTGMGEQLDNATVIMSGGRILAVGTDVEVPSDVATIDGSGKWVTPGIIDPHSHLGDYASPNTQASSDGNEATSPNTAEVWAEHSVWPQDPGFTRALAGGVTTIHVLPGSANLFGGRGVTLKNVMSRTVQGMKFPGAPYTLKMACGENPKRVYGSRGRAPSTRMGNMAGYREAWIRAQGYKAQWDDYKAKIAKGEEATPPTRDLQLETLMGVLNGEILVENHCYRADEMANVLDMAKEFGYKVTAFHHAIEAYKIADLLKANGTCAVTWADWWGFKMEAYDSVRENTALVEHAGACVTIHSDDQEFIQRLNQEAAKAMADGNRAGLGITRAVAIKWITANPAKALGIDKEVGSLEAGKAADVVLWTRDPFSVYAHAEKVYIDGALLYDRDNPALSPRSDFEIGQATYDTTGGAGQ